MSCVKEDLKRLNYGKMLGFDVIVSKKITPGACFFSEKEIAIETVLHKNSS